MTKYNSERLKQASDARAQKATSSKIIYSGMARIIDEEIEKITTDLYSEG